MENIYYSHFGSSTKDTKKKYILAMILMFSIMGIIFIIRYIQGWLYFLKKVLKPKSPHAPLKGFKKYYDLNQKKMKCIFLQCFKHFLKKQKNGISGCGGQV